jgi:hypothetical protein
LEICAKNNGKCPNKYTVSYANDLFGIRRGVISVVPNPDYISEGKYSITMKLCDYASGANNRNWVFAWGSTMNQKWGFVINPSNPCQEKTVELKNVSLATEFKLHVIDKGNYKEIYKTTFQQLFISSNNVTYEVTKKSNGSVQTSLKLND